MNIHSFLVTTRCYTTTLGIPLFYKQKLINETYNIGDIQNRKTNVKASMSYWDIFDHTPIFNTLLDNIFKVITTQTHYKNYARVKELIIDEAWVNIYRKGDYTLSHNHLPSVVSFVYYLQSNGSSTLNFTNSEFKITPKDDLLVIFDSSLEHSVDKHLDKQDRICLAGNLTLKT